MQRTFLAGVVGLIFGTGIALSGMANPAKVLNFFDVAGTWDPSLAFVMGGALVVTAIGYRLVLRRAKPVCETKFHIPTNRKLDLPLVAGSAVFGIGWGISGFCPGGAIPALGLGEASAWAFVGAMLIGIFAARSIRLAHGQRLASAT
ncbi:YeeE/YedE family protein [Devosia sp.]|uniref:YeeE/YedE family protein n=1 Tax=Devosia sp. TaxID=1871048 RepID=UPI001AC51659|nr:YeeE/YedE family protein [Devosia sp.]MBN9335460.1 YeeE/YedE family protein [Devosia sp.]